MIARLLAKAVIPMDRYRSQLERDYAVILSARQQAADVLWHAYQPWKFEIGAGIWYTPDFAAQLADGTMEITETKGFMREAARVRLLAAVRLYPMFRWRVVRRDAQGWHVEEITP